MMEPPKMSPKMKQDFAQFASDNLYNDKINDDLIIYISDVIWLVKSTRNSRLLFLHLELAEQALQVILKCFMKN